ncbi:hypothetical protein PUN28_020791 [Cardiocondyla obscurior]|uniref:Uncharacterized protein n=1 Tax=Cardiocondyla obscurior TaxID=286306 RepID=A0AAW2E960_9HYME
MKFLSGGERLDCLLISSGLKWSGPTVKAPSGIGSVHGVQVLRRSSRRGSMIAFGSSFFPEELNTRDGDGVKSGKSNSGKEIESSSARDSTFSGSTGKQRDGERGEEQA